ncbi:MAG: Na+/H+ antiporter subunit E [Candidatus Onthomonas sp.]
MFLLLFLLWLILNGRLASDVVLSGLVLCGAVDAFALRFFRWNITKSWRWGELLPAMLSFVGILLWEIIQSNLKMMRLIADPHMKEKVQPRMVQFELVLRSDLAKAMLANAITLTPGTITVRERVSANAFVVHALTPEMGDGLEDCPLARAVTRIDRAICGEEAHKEGEHV